MQNALGLFDLLKQPAPTEKRAPQGALFYSLFDGDVLGGFGLRCTAALAFLA